MRVTQIYQQLSCLNVFGVLVASVALVPGCVADAEPASENMSQAPISPGSGADNTSQTPESPDTGKGDSINEPPPQTESIADRGPILLDLDEEFTFCTDALPSLNQDDAYGVDLNNATWLAFLSGNAYAGFPNYAPVLDEMGFGAPGEADEWVAFADRLDRGEVAAAEQQQRFQEAIPGALMQFFSGGKLSADETVFAEGSTQGVWIQHRELPLVVVSFRGTETDQANDIIVDARFFKTDEPLGGKVHNGFQAAFESVEQLLFDKLDQIEGTSVQVWLTGHSLGGALATIFASRMLERMEQGRDYPLAGLYTYGSPRVGNKAWAAAFEQAADTHQVALMRFRHANDIVTQIPLINYQHVGELMFIQSTKAGGAFLFRDDDVGGIVGPAISEVSAIGDHDISRYYTRTRGHRDALPDLTRCTSGRLGSDEVFTRNSGLGVPADNGYIDNQYGQP